MAVVLIGTSGYSYDDWVGPVYPAGTPRNRYLEEYQRHFSFVEINSSYYAIPKPSLSRSLVARSSDGFRFSVKTHRSFTHDHGGRVGPSLDQQIEAYLMGIAPLAEAGRLAGILAQFPWSFHYTPENRRYLAAAAARFHRIASDILPGSTLAAPGSKYGIRGGCPLFLEMRNDEWHGPAMAEGLREHSLFPVYQDGPDLDRLPGHLDRQIAGKAAGDPPYGKESGPGYIRFHGRNRDNWWTGTNVTRYDYLYSDSELDSLISAVRTIAKGSEPTTIIAFNNHHRGQAVQNARSLQLMLDAGSDVDETN
jgi:uncharacterized protein YecE (DUF72 family)